MEDNILNYPKEATLPKVDHLQFEELETMVVPGAKATVIGFGSGVIVGGLIWGGIVLT